MVCKPYVNLVESCRLVLEPELLGFSCGSSGPLTSGVGLLTPRPSSYQSRLLRGLPPSIPPLARAAILTLSLSLSYIPSLTRAAKSYLQRLAIQMALLLQMRSSIYPSGSWWLRSSSVLVELPEELESSSSRLSSSALKQILHQASIPVLGTCSSSS